MCKGQVRLVSGGLAPVLCRPATWILRCCLLLLQPLLPLPRPLLPLLLLLPPPQRCPGQGG
jgi:hypothetical protein